ncbi:hypothetical protein SLL00_03560 [Metabacillus indicus]|uniref:hypothetical protein n=1 Tax=Metabacillus indicus TaxID=246786 RepID=UPI002A01331A|nr:hypothetical protein [Metabacillus indicus]MDX8288851.1 hypothetical protein [Metabacillus indicus]
MNWDKATKKQLLQIALKEDCEFSDKFAAIRELQLRRWTDDMLTDLVRLWGMGQSIISIATELGTEPDVVNMKLQKYGLFKRRVGA